MFVLSAFAQETAPAGVAPDAMLQFLPIVLIFVVFYFLLIRPQQKKMREHREMLSAIRRGDRVVTGGGIIGTVIKVIEESEELQVEIAEGVRVRVQRPAVSAVLAKPEPAQQQKEPPKGGDASGAGSGQGESKPSAGRPSRLTKILGGKRD
jgi:preprotein translocase subunit YajC